MAILVAAAIKLGGSPGAAGGDAGQGPAGSARIVLEQGAL
ncbi:hypothetical protein X907_2126 [Glycocaulis alkaliphilus]|uniref:Uncharacterized protein n=1 Tax=Glycocaulis alkaliphilus TaxID=1434191 RepID=A0A3T0EBR3_9PROT|nr:hypothetical protein X907_2126 [Glycocaulis alkaliphilus]